MKQWYLPTGGVRAYVAVLAITAATAFAGWEVYQTGKAPEWFVGLLGTVIGYYFMAAKSGE